MEEVETLGMRNYESLVRFDDNFISTGISLRGPLKKVWAWKLKYFRPDTVISPNLTKNYFGLRMNSIPISLQILSRIILKHIVTNSHLRKALWNYRAPSSASLGRGW